MRPWQWHFFCRREIEMRVSTGIPVQCHRCGYSWVYFGYKAELVGKVRNTIRIQCRHCKTSTILIKGTKKPR
jgi:DNA-directed RNA polymerase subunit RPC12/RpoP